MKYSIIQTKAGYAVQNTQTMAIVNVYQTKQQAKKVCINLNTTKQQPLVYELN